MSGDIFTFACSGDKPPLRLSKLESDVLNHALGAAQQRYNKLPQGREKDQVRLDARRAIRMLFPMLSDGAFIEPSPLAEVSEHFIDLHPILLRSKSVGYMFRPLPPGLGKIIVDRK